MEAASRRFYRSGEAARCRFHIVSVARARCFYSGMINMVILIEPSLTFHVKVVTLFRYQQWQPVVELSVGLTDGKAKQTP